MIGVSFNASDLITTLNNTVKYTNSFLTESKRGETKVATKISNLSIEVFYDYLDGLARSHPGMLHHVYEWGQIGNPTERLFELKLSLAKNAGIISVDLLQSTSLPENGNDAFYDKASIMEEGIPVIITEKEAQSLFFEIDGEEFFRKGPIYIANPGGEGTRGSFVKAFNEFYTLYFDKVFLQSIRFYEHFSDPKDYKTSFRSAAKSKSGASGIGKKAALSWIDRTPGSAI
jgi:hypothetical protein